MLLLKKQQQRNKSVLWITLKHNNNKMNNQPKASLSYVNVNQSNGASIDPLIIAVYIHCK